MPSEPQWIPLENCLDALIDYRGKTPEKTSSGVPLITAKVVKGGVIERPTEFIAHEAYSAWMRRGIPLAGDVLLTTEAPLGEVAQLKFAHVALAQRIILLRGKSGVLHNGYLKYFFLTEEGHRSLEARASGTTVLGIKQSELRRVEIPIIPFDEQVQIFDTLQSLDDKIALLRETNATLEAIAQALFKSWFVDFDPVRAKAEGRDQEGVPPEFGSSFPSEFEDHEFGLIPKGWKEGSLDSIAEFLNGLAMQKFPVEDESEWLPVIKIAQLRKGDTVGADRASLRVPSDYVVEDGDVLFSWSGSLEVEIWCGGKGGLNQHLFKVTSKKFAKWFFYLWTKHHLASFRNIAANKATTMGHIQRHHLTEARVVIPPASLLKVLSNTIEPLFLRMTECRLQVKTLLAIRDNLLPRLISGKIQAEGCSV